jgi:hypothetical protein
MNAQSIRQSAKAKTRPPVITPVAIVAKTVVCVALIAGLAWIGASERGDLTPPDSVVNAEAVSSAVVAGDRAAAHRRLVFEERRARYEARTPTHVAGTGPEHPYP